MLKKLLLLFLLMFFSLHIFAMDSFTEDSWIGAYLLKPSSLTEFERIKPFLDIRLSNVNNNDYDNIFKTAIADYILISQFSFYNIMNGVNNSAEFYDIYNSLSLKEKEYYITELSAFLLLADELSDKVNILNDSLQGNVFYHFYHIEYVLFEEVTTPDLVQEVQGFYDTIFPFSDQEFNLSINNTTNINNLLPIFPEDIKYITESPLISQSYIEYDDYSKARLRNLIEGAIFITNEQVVINDIRIDINTLTNYRDNISFIHTQIYNILNNYNLNIKRNEPIDNLFSYLLNNRGDI